jgi:hypothetical protein
MHTISKCPSNCETYISAYTFFISVENQAFWPVCHVPTAASSPKSCLSRPTCARKSLAAALCQGRKTWCQPVMGKCLVRSARLAEFYGTIPTSQPLPSVRFGQVYSCVKQKPDSGRCTIVHRSCANTSHVISWLTCQLSIVAPIRLGF